MLALVTCEGARHLDADLPLLEDVLPEPRIGASDDPTVDDTAPAPAASRRLTS